MRPRITRKHTELGANAGSFLQIEPKYFERIKIIRPAIVFSIREISEHKKGV
ncbi:MAG: hypothetical protein P9L97_06995 [Candidatus Tenebribacter davisii]|nr:hypothetical protein [Candidatus Tenebribacter davisii]